MRSTLKCSFAQCSLKAEINVSWSTQFGGSAVPPLFRSFAVGLSVLAYHAFGDAISPPIIGWLGDRLSLGHAIALNAIPVFLGGLLLVVGARLLHGPPAHRVDA